MKLLSPTSAPQAQRSHGVPASLVRCRNPPEPGHLPRPGSVLGYRLGSPPAQPHRLPRLVPSRSVPPDPWRGGLCSSAAHLRAGLEVDPLGAAPGRAGEDRRRHSPHRQPVHRALLRARPDHGRNGAHRRHGRLCHGRFPGGRPQRGRRPGGHRDGAGAVRVPGVVVYPGSPGSVACHSRGMAGQAPPGVARLAREEARQSLGTRPRARPAAPRKG